MEPKISSFPDLQQGFTQIPNHFLDKIAPDLSPSELRVMLFVYRRCLGWQKTANSFTYEQFVEGAKVSRRALVPALAALEVRGLIARQQLGRYAPVYIELRPVAPVVAPAPNAGVRAPLDVADLPLAAAPVADMVEATALVQDDPADADAQNLRDKSAENRVDAQKIHLMNHERKTELNINRAAVVDQGAKLIRKGLDSISHKEALRLAEIAVVEHGRDVEYLRRVMGYVNSTPQIRNPAAVFTNLVKMDQDRTDPRHPLTVTRATAGADAYIRRHKTDGGQPHPPKQIKGPVNFDKFKWLTQPLQAVWVEEVQA